MTHFGIICPPFFSHLKTLGALGQKLQSRGHQVTVLQIPDVAWQVNAQGLSFYPIGQSIYRPGSLAETIQQLANFNGIDALQQSIEFCAQMSAIVCQDASDAISSLGIEALLVDQLEPAGEAVAEFLDIPFISVCNSQAIHRQSMEVPPFFTHWRYLDTGWARIRNRIAYHLLDCYSKQTLNVLNTYRAQWKLPHCYRLYDWSNTHSIAQISQQPAEFDFPCTKLPSRFHYVGPLRSASETAAEAFPYEKLAGKPLIYASLGTIQHTKQELFHCIAMACAEIDVQLVITLGGRANTLQNLPGSPIIVESAPQLEILQRSQLAITHAGLNTVLDSLSQGVPMVAIPITYEQPGNAARIHWTGTGKAIPFAQIEPLKLRTTIQHVLGEASYKQNAMRLKQAIQQTGGVQQAASIIEQAISLGDGNQRDLSRETQLAIS